jgi:hypothetical protein
MASAIETHHWLSRFAMRLMELRPDVSFRAAVARAAAAYAYAKNLSPEDAAQVDVEARGVGLGAQGTDVDSPDVTAPD